MPASSKLSRGRDFLQTTPEGVVDLTHSKEILLKILQQTVSPPDYDILVDLRRSQWQLSVADVYDLANEINKNSELYRDKIAVLVLPGTNPDATELFQVFSNARGLNVKVFTNFEDAIQWFFIPIGISE